MPTAHRCPTPLSTQGRRLARIWLHVGLEKTGSTSVLESLRRSGDRLEAAGLAVPRGPHDQRSLAHVFRRAPMVEMLNLGLSEAGAQDAYRARLAEGLAQALAATGAEEALISDEMLASLSLEEAKAMAAFLAPFAAEIRVVAYVRAPLDAAVSLSQQLIRTGHALYSEMARLPTYRPVRRRLEVFRTVFGADHVSVRRFARDALAGGSIQSDLLQAIRRPELAGLMDPHSTNESLTLQGALLKSAMSRLSDTPVRQHHFLPLIGGHPFTLPPGAAAAVEPKLALDRAWLGDTYHLRQADRALPPLPDDAALFDDGVLASMATARTRVPDRLRPVFDAALNRMSSGAPWDSYA